MAYIPAVNYSKSGAPDAPRTQIMTVAQFDGVDLTSEPTHMSVTRSPDCRNMMRAAPGKVKRRPGSRIIFKYDSVVNGGAFTHPTKNLVHIGTNIYWDYRSLAGSRDDAVSNGINTGVADNRSVFVVMNTTDKAYFFDGSNFRTIIEEVIDGRTVRYAPPVSEHAYIPTVMIDRDPIGGGTAFEDINVLSDAFTELFYADGESTVYQMSLDNLMSEKGSVVKILNNDGLTWRTLAEGSNYSVNYTTGVITFATAPTVTPVSGQSNVSITVSKDRSEKRSWIDRCTVATCFGDSSSGARLFCAGNPDYPNRDFWSELDDPSYFSDLNYSILGDTSSGIVGYSALGSTLATHKYDGTIFVRAAVTDEDNMFRQMFPVQSIIRGPRNIAPGSFAVLNNEPLFLTENGIYALTSADLTAEKYAQRRSFYLDGALLKESHLSSATACVWKNNYLLAVNDKVYILDGTSKSYAQDEPHSTYQYEGFVWTGIRARHIWASAGELYFGTDAGDICWFKDSMTHDECGGAITSCWQTPDLQGASYYHYKHFTRLALQLTPGEESTVEIHANSGGSWAKLAEKKFAPSEHARLLVRRLKFKKSTSAAFRIQSDQLPFEPDAISIEYIQTGHEEKRS